jgi:hypothetical protein
LFAAASLAGLLEPLLSRIAAVLLDSLFEQPVLALWMVRLKD